ncbi:hypothetical protein KA012_04960 [Candidatus Woesebacteria bacterium]|nr:hypothetical protein [Candidatus Woesebacteria bacterium]
MTAAQNELNQTQFSTEEPFFEQPGAVFQEAQEIKQVVPFFKRRKTIISLIIVVTLLLLFVLFVINLIVERNRRLGAPPVITTETPAPTTANTYAQEVEQLRLEWKAVDPSQSELQPPSVDPSIRLDQLQR